MLKLKCLPLAMLILMSGCRGTVVPIETGCSWIKPITTNKADRASMSRDLKEQVLVHNDLWDSHCMK